MDITRILIRVSFDFCLPEAISVVIDDDVFVIKLMENTFGPIRIVYNKDRVLSSSSSSSCSEEYWSELEGNLNIEDGDNFGDSLIPEKNSQTVGKA